MDVRAPLVPDLETPELTDPGPGALDHPSVLSQALTGFHAFAGDSTANPPPAKIPLAPADVVGLVCVHLLRPVPGSACAAAPHPRDRIEECLEDPAVVDVGGRNQHGERNATPVHNDVALRSRLAPVGGIRPRVLASLRCGNARAIRDARLQSICPASCKRSSNS